MSDKYKIGYGKPPKHSQFKPGQSGNPRGRPKPKKSHLLTDFENIFMKREKVMVNGEEQNLSGSEVLLILLKQFAMKEKNHKDRRIVFDFMKLLQMSERYSNYSQENSDYMQDLEEDDDL